MPKIRLNHKIYIILHLALANYLAYAKLVISQRHRLTIMKFAKNMLAAIGLMALLVIALNTVSAVAGVIGDAFDRQQSAHDAKIAEHKASLPNDDGNYVTDPMNGFDDEVIDTYETSTEAKTASHANGFIAKAYGRE